MRGYDHQNRSLSHGRQNQTMSECCVSCSRAIKDASPLMIQWAISYTCTGTYFRVSTRTPFKELIVICIIFRRLSKQCNIKTNYCNIEWAVCGNYIWLKYIYMYIYIYFFFQFVTSLNHPSQSVWKFERWLSNASKSNSRGTLWKEKITNVLRSYIFMKAVRLYCRFFLVLPYFYLLSQRIWQVST